MIRNFLTFFLVVPLVLCFAADCHARDKYADLAGTWYRSSPVALRNELNGYMDSARIRRLEGDVVSLVAPHAGFSFSGGVAGYAFNVLREMSPETVVIAGFTHRRRYPGSISVFTAPAFVTPLGRAETNTEITGRFLDFHGSIRDIPGAFQDENSVEMLIPFVQAALPDSRLVLLAISDQDLQTSMILADALYEVMSGDESVMVVASTDMSHFLSHEEAVAADNESIEEIKRMEPRSLYRYSLEREHRAMCGHGAVRAVMAASIRMGADRFEVLKYATSGDVTGDKDRVVGYLSGAFTMSGERSPVTVPKEEEVRMFSDRQRRELLSIARTAISSYLTTGEEPDIEVDDPDLKMRLGGFVTIKKDGELRGCLGNMVGVGPFYMLVRDMAIASAVNDPRFPPLQKDELGDIDIEISALSPMRRIEDPYEIEMGKHGVMVRMGRRSGVYLPQVATDSGWTFEEFMGSLCVHKAGIPRDAWRTGQAEIYVYTAEVFSEKDLEMPR